MANTTSDGWRGYDACINVSRYGCADGNPGLSAVGGNISAYGAFTPGTKVHTYRVEAKDNVINLIIDGGLVITITDNELFTGSQVGLWCEADQLEVLSFQVVAL